MRAIKIYEDKYDGVFPQLFVFRRSLFVLRFHGIGKKKHKYINQLYPKLYSNRDGTFLHDKYEIWLETWSNAYRNDLEAHGWMDSFVGPFLSLSLEMFDSLALIDNM